LTITNLAGRGISAAKWNLSGNLGKAAIQFVFGIVLALLLIGLGNLVSDAGLSAAIIQRKEVDRTEVNFVFTLQVLVGAALTILGLVVAGPIAQFFGAPQAESIIQVMSALFLVRAVGQTGRALLARNLNYLGLQALSIGSYVAGYGCVGILMALSGYGVWSLVAAHLVSASLESGLAVLIARPFPTFSLTASPQKMGTFGGKVIASNIVSWIILNIDSMIVGRSLGPMLLGVYNRGMTLVASPAHALVAGLQGVLFATCSRAGGDYALVKRAYLSTTMAVSLACFPVFLTVAVVPEVVVLSLYGERWAAAVPLLPPLAIAMTIHAVLAMIGPVLMSVDRTEKELFAQGLIVVPVALIVYVGSHWSLEGVGWAVVLGYLLRFALLFRGLVEAISVSLLELGRSIFLPLVVGTLVAGVVAASQAPLAHLPPEGRLLSAAGVAAAAVAIQVFLLRKWLFAGDLGRIFQMVRR
jgi:lipopolysaccharide exporter